MSDTVTLDDVWKLFRESDRKLQESKLEWDRHAQELRQMFQETDRQFKETDLERKKTSQELKELGRYLKEVGQRVDGLSSKWGLFVENMVAPACETLFAARGIPVHEVHQRVRRKQKGGRNMEIDILVVNTDAVVLVEVKSTLTVEDVRLHVERLKQFKEFMPLYADFRVFGAVSGIVIDSHADSFARNQGLFVIVQSGDIMKLANEADFTPINW